MGMFGFMVSALLTSAACQEKNGFSSDLIITKKNAGTLSPHSEVLGKPVITDKSRPRYNADTYDLFA